MNEKILIVDDDINIAELLTLYLNKDGYKTKKAHSGRAALSAFSEFSPNLVLLDIMLPELDGYEICREIRRAGNVPIIMMTAKGETFDKVLGLELGADDYIVKPFDTKEVLARIKAVLRRTENRIQLSGSESQAAADKTVTIPNLTISQATYTAVYRGQRLELPPKEFELLYFLASHPNIVYTRDQLLDNIWGYDFYGDTRTVDVHIKRLREKLGGGESWELKTVWGVGYKFEVNK